MKVFKRIKIKRILLQKPFTSQRIGHFCTIKNEPIKDPQNKEIEKIKPKSSKRKDRLVISKGTNVEAIGENEENTENLSIFGYTDLYLSKSIDSVSNLLHSSVDLISSALDKGGDVVKKSIETVNTEVVEKRMPTIIKVPVPEMVKNRSKDIKDLSEKANESLGIVGNIGSEVGKVIGTTSSKLVDSVLKGESQESSKTVESLKNLGSTLSKNAIKLLNSLDKTTSDIVDEVEKLGVNTTKKIFGEEVGHISKDLYHTTKNVVDGIKTVKGMNTHKLVKEGVVSTAKSASKEFVKVRKEENEEGIKELPPKEEILKIEK